MHWRDKPSVGPTNNHTPVTPRACIVLQKGEGGTLGGRSGKNKRGGGYGSSLVQNPPTPLSGWLGIWVEGWLNTEMPAPPGRMPEISSNCSDSWNAPPLFSSHSQSELVYYIGPKNHLITPSPGHCATLAIRSMIEPPPHGRAAPTPMAVSLCKKESQVKSKKTAFSHEKSRKSLFFVTFP